MNAATEALVSELDRVSDSQQPSTALAAELFGVADLLREQAMLRNALADSTSQDGHRRALAESVFAGRLSAAASAVVSEAAGLRWGSSSRLIAAIDRQGLRVLFATAQASGKLDLVEEELFRLNRMVAADLELRSALDDRNAPVAVRQQLLSDLLAKKANDVTVLVAQRAVAFSQRPFEPTTEEYLRLAAAVRARAIALVTVAKPLSTEQVARFKAILTGKLNRDINLQIVVDPSVLGGARVRVGDEVIEGTVAARLAAAEQQLTQ